MFAQLYVERAEKAIKASIPEPSFLLKKIPFWKLTVNSWNKKEFTNQVEKLTDDMVSQFIWLKEKLEHAKEEAYHAHQGDNKEKLKACNRDILLLEHQCEAFNLLVPRVKHIQKNVKTIIKSEDCPEEFATDLACIVYFSSIFGMPSFERVKTQLGYKFGQKYIDRIIGKHAGVDDTIYENVMYKAESKEVKEKAKEVSKESKERAVEEVKLSQECNKAFFVESFTSLAKPTSTGHKKQKKEKKEKKQKKEKKDDIESESDSESDSEYDTTDSESEKKGKNNEKKKEKSEKKGKKEENKEKENNEKVKKVKAFEETTSDEETPKVEVAHEKNKVNLDKPVPV